MPFGRRNASGHVRNLKTSCLDPIDPALSETGQTEAHASTRETPIFARQVQDASHLFTQDMAILQGHLQLVDLRYVEGLLEESLGSCNKSALIASEPGRGDGMVHSLKYFRYFLR